MAEAPAHVELAVLEDARSVHQARRFVQAHLSRWSVDADVTGDAVLVTSELVTNALRYGCGPRRLELDLAADRLRIAVDDAGDGRPRPRQPVLDQEGGRGLALLEAVSEKWGTDDRPAAGKRVWCELVLP